MTQNTSRSGTFSSSSIWKLMKVDKSGKKFGAPALTYIDEKKMEIKLGRELSQDISPRSASRGTFVEKRVLNTLLSTSYKPTSKKRFVHETIKQWTGSPDATTDDAVSDVKCFELKNFCKTHDAASIGVEALKKECPEVWWQLVSNAAILKKPKITLILYVPYQKELSAIKEEASQPDVEHEFQWIQYAKDDELPYLIEGGHYKNLTLFTFEVPQEDVLSLTNHVIMATKLLNE